MQSRPINDHDETPAFKKTLHCVEEINEVGETACFAFTQIFPEGVFNDLAIISRGTGKRERRIAKDIADAGLHGDPLLGGYFNFSNNGRYLSQHKHRKTFLTLSQTVKYAESIEKQLHLLGKIHGIGEQAYKGYCNLIQSKLSELWLAIPKEMIYRTGEYYYQQYKNDLVGQLTNNLVLALGTTLLPEMTIVPKVIYYFSARWTINSVSHHGICLVEDYCFNNLRKSIEEDAHFSQSLLSKLRLQPAMIIDPITGWFVVSPLSVRLNFGDDLVIDPRKDLDKLLSDFQAEVIDDHVNENIINHKEKSHTTLPSVKINIPIYQPNDSTTITSGVSFTSSGFVSFVKGSLPDTQQTVTVQAGFDRGKFIASLGIAFALPTSAVLTGSIGLLLGFGIYQLYASRKAHWKAKKEAEINVFLTCFCDNMQSSNINAARCTMESLIKFYPDEPSFQSLNQSLYDLPLLTAHAIYLISEKGLKTANCFYQNAWDGCVNPDLRYKYLFADALFQKGYYQASQQHMAEISKCLLNAVSVEDKQLQQNAVLSQGLSELNKPFIEHDVSFLFNLFDQLTVENQLLLMGECTQYYKRTLSIYFDQYPEHCQRMVEKMSDRPNLFYELQADCFLSMGLRSGDYQTRLTYFEKGFEVNSNNIALSIVLSQTYCQAMQFRLGKKVLEKTLSSFPDNQNIKHVLNDINDKEIKLYLLIVDTADFFSKRFLKILSNSDYRTLASFSDNLYQLTAVTAIGMNVYFNWRLAKQSEHFSKYSFYARNGLSISHSALLFFSKNKNINKQKWINHSSTAMDTALTAVDLYELSKQHDSLMGSICIFSFLDRQLFSRLREEGRAPLNKLGILAEDFSKTAVYVSGPLFFLKKHQKSLGSILEAVEVRYPVVRESIDWANNKITNIKMKIPNHSSNTPSDTPSHTPSNTPSDTTSGNQSDDSSKGLLEKTQDTLNNMSGLHVAIALAVLGVVAYGTNRYLDYRKYNNQLSNAETHLKLMKQKTESAASHLKQAKDSIVPVLQQYPTDKKTIRFSKQITVREMLLKDDHTIKDALDALSICHTWLQEHPSDDEMRKEKISVGIEIFKKHAAYENREVLIKEIEKELAVLMKHDPKAIESHILKINAEAAMGYLNAALASNHTLQRLARDQVFIDHLKESSTQLNDAMNDLSKQIDMQSKQLHDAVNQCLFGKENESIKEGIGIQIDRSIQSLYVANDCIQQFTDEQRMQWMLNCYHHSAIPLCVSEKNKLITSLFYAQRASNNDFMQHYNSVCQIVDTIKNDFQSIKVDEKIWETFRGVLPQETIDSLKKDIVCKETSINNYLLETEKKLIQLKENSERHTIALERLTKFDQSLTVLVNQNNKTFWNKNLFTIGAGLLKMPTFFNMKYSPHLFHRPASKEVKNNGWLSKLSTTFPKKAKYVIASKMKP